MPARRPPSSHKRRPRRTAAKTAASIPKPQDIVDRDAVWADLVAMWRRPSPEMLFGVGRRRAGKSWVLTRFAKAVGGIYYQATKRTATEQLTTLSRIVGHHFDDPALGHGVPFPDWEALFAYLVDRTAGQPLLLVLDEFPYLAEAAPALPSIVQAAWDHRWKATRIKLVLNGSHITAMRQLEAADQPLYGRRTGRILFPPFHAEHVSAFVSGYDARDRLRTFGIFGGLPGHLALLDPTATLQANVERQILDPGARLADEAQHMLDAFLGEADVHNSIVQAVAAGARTWSRIANQLGKTAGSLSRPMRWLEEMQVVTRAVPITEAKPQASKRTLYRVADPYVAFWYRFIAPIVATGALGLLTPKALWRGHIAPRLDDYMGAPFEDVCRGWVARTGRLPFRPSRVGAWWDSGSQNEIDVVALGPEREILVGECKWGAVSDQDLVTLRNRAALLATELPASHQGGAVHLVVFSGNGTWGPGVARAIADGMVLGVTGDDLFAL